MRRKAFIALLLCGCLLTGCSEAEMDAVQRYLEESGGTPVLFGSVDASGEDAELDGTPEEGQDPSDGEPGDGEDAAETTDAAEDTEEPSGTETPAETETLSETRTVSGTETQSGTENGVTKSGTGTAVGGETAGNPGAALVNQELTVLIDTDLWEDEGTYAACRYNVPIMTLLRRDRTAVTEEDADIDERNALEVAETFNEAFHRWAEDADFPGLEAAAREDYAFRMDAGIPWEGQYTQELSCQVYQAKRLVSVTGEVYAYTGGAHPNTALVSWNFDLLTGRYFTADALFEDAAPVTEALRREAEEHAAEYGAAAEEFFFPGWEDTLAEWPENAAVSFDRAVMTVAYSPYELAPYAAGPQVFTLPLSEVLPHMNAYGLAVLNG